MPCPTNIVTGALASGKTTVLKNLLLAKPPEEVWAVLVNEFGAAGLDAALLEEGGGSGTSGGSEGGRDGAGVHIQQLAGGCLCCAMSNVTPLAIAQLLRQAKPDRWGSFGGIVCRHRANIRHCTCTGRASPFPVSPPFHDSLSLPLVQALD